MPEGQEGHGDPNWKAKEYNIKSADAIEISPEAATQLREAVQAAEDGGTWELITDGVEGNMMKIINGKPYYWVPSTNPEVVARNRELALKNQEAYIQRVAAERAAARPAEKAENARIDEERRKHPIPVIITDPNPTRFNDFGEMRSQAKTVAIPSEVPKKSRSFLDTVKSFFGR